MLGSSALQLAGVVDLSKSIYPGPNFTWLSYLVGGFLFGVGMTLGSGCGSKTLIRIGGGNLKSLVVYVFLGIAAYMTLRGLFGAFRVGVLEKAVDHAADGAGPSVAAGAATGMARRLIARRRADRRRRCLPSSTRAGNSARASTTRLGGVVTGLVVVGGWYVSGKLGHVAEDPEDAAGGLRRHQHRPHGIVLLRLAARLHARVPDVLDRQVEDRHLRHRLGRWA